MTLAFINILLNKEHHYDIWKIKDRLILQIDIVGLNGILDIGSVGYLQMMKGKLFNGKEL